MTRFWPITVAAALAPLLAVAARDAGLDRGWYLYESKKYAEAQAFARDYEKVHGRIFKAEFLIVMAQCEITPHRSSNVQALRQLGLDFVPSYDGQRSINDNIKYCGPKERVAESGGQALSLGPSTTFLAYDKFDPPLRHPPPPRIVAHPFPIPAPTSSQPAACRLLSYELAQGTASAATIASLRAACTRASSPATTVVVAPPPPAPPPATAALPPDVEAANAARRQRYLAARCRAPYVWRDAFRGDRVCVEPQVRDDAASDNAHADERRDPTGAYGPMTCVNGYVWRSARDGDAVCVVPQRRDQAAADNAAAASRRLQP